MSIGDFLTLATIAVAVVAITPVLGGYIHRVMEGQRVFLSPLMRPIEGAVPHFRPHGPADRADADLEVHVVGAKPMPGR